MSVLRWSSVVLLLTVVIWSVIQTTQPSLGHANQQASECFDIIVNGGFENSAVVLAPWVVEMGLAFPTDDPRYSGQFSAWTGGYRNADDRLYQSITLPQFVSSATLNYWWNMHTTDDEVTAYDALTVTVRDGQGGLLQELEMIDNTGLRDTWVQSAYDLSSFAGRDVRVHFRCTGNSQYVTSFFLDEVSLTVCQLPTVVVYLPLVLQFGQ